MHEKFIRLGSVLDILGSPQKDLRFVHVTGSNGKGSTCAMIASILKEAGHTVGLFTSPHIHKWNERIKVNGVDILDKDLEEIGKRVDEVVMDLGIELSEMERFFVIALVHFGQSGIDFGVIEVGIGGRLDATNIIDGEISIITNIELEHSHILGDTVEKIAYDKAGIIKEGATCITTEIDEKLIEVFAKEAKEKGAKLIVLEESDVAVVSQSQKGQVFNFMDNMNVELPLLGDYQLSNAALAVTCGEILGVESYVIKQGLKHVRWPLRLEVVKSDGPTVLIDGAHTIRAMTSTLKTINQFWNDYRKVVVVGFSEGKEFEEMLDLLLEKVDVFIVTRAEYKGLDVKKIVSYLEKKGASVHSAEPVSSAMKQALEIAQKDDLVMVLGGLYLGAEAKGAMQQQISHFEQ